MNVAVVYESLGGNTKRAAEMIAGAATFLGAEATVMNIMALDLGALAKADLIFVGSWTDGVIIAGHRPGRAGRFSSFPWIDGKRVASFCTYAVNPGKTAEKLGNILAGRGAEIVGSKAIKRTQIDSKHVSPFVAEMFSQVLAAAA